MTAGGLAARASARLVAPAAIAIGSRPLLSLPGSVSREFSMKNRAFLLAAVLLAASPLAAQEGAPLKTVVDGTFAPHAMPKLGGGYEGFNIDLATEIGKRLKRPVTIDAVQFSGIVPALQAGTYDFVAAPTTVTKERADNMLFTEGYLNTDFQFLVKKGGPKVEKLEDLKGKIVSVNKGSAYDSWARELEAKIGWKVESLRHPDRRRAGRARRPRRRERRRQYGDRLGGEEQSAARTVLSLLDRARLGRAAAQGFRRAAQDNRERHRMHEARRHDRHACTRSGSASSRRPAPPP